MVTVKVGVPEKRQVIFVGRVRVESLKHRRHRGKTLREGKLSTYWTTERGKYAEEFSLLKRVLRRIFSLRD